MVSEGSKGGVEDERHTRRLFIRKLIKREALGKPLHLVRAQLGVPRLTFASCMIEENAFASHFLRPEVV